MSCFSVIIQLTRPGDPILIYCWASIGSTDHAWILGHVINTYDLPDGSFSPVEAPNLEVLGSNPGRVGCLSSGLCIYSAQLQTFQSHGVCSACCLWYCAL